MDPSIYNFPVLDEGFNGLPQWYQISLSPRHTSCSTSQASTPARPQRCQQLDPTPLGPSGAATWLRHRILLLPGSTIPWLSGAGDPGDPGGSRGLQGTPQDTSLVISKRFRSFWQLCRLISSSRRSSSTPGGGRGSIVLISLVFIWRSNFMQLPCVSPPFPVASGSVIKYGNDWLRAKLETSTLPSSAQIRSLSNLAVLQFHRPSWDARLLETKYRATLEYSWMGLG